MSSCRGSLHLTTMCLQYKPTVVACVCIHLVCKWFNYDVSGSLVIPFSFQSVAPFSSYFSFLFFPQIPLSSEGKEWFSYVDKTVTLEQLDELTVEFLTVFNKCPSRLRRRVLQQPGVNPSALSGKESSHSDTHKVKSHPESSGGSSSSSASLKPGTIEPLNQFKNGPLFDNRRSSQQVSEFRGRTIKEGTSRAPLCRRPVRRPALRLATVLPPTVATRLSIRVGLRKAPELKATTTNITTTTMRQAGLLIRTSGQVPATSRT